ncbi:MAG: hypothetical protein PVG07_08255 [Acidobacteriota bacterium]|jgi:hypothetical protein
MRGSEQPFLFFPEDLDVRWRSFATVAEQAAGGRRALAGLGLEPGARVAYSWSSSPDAVAADLAIRWGGWTAAPLSTPVTDAGEGGPPEHAARLLLPFEAGTAPATGPSALLPPAGSELGRRGAEEALPEGRELSGALLVRDGGRTPADDSEGSDSPDGWRRVGPEALDRAVEALDRELDRTWNRTPDWRLSRGSSGAGSRVEGGGDRERPVVAAWLDAAAPGGRVVLAWAVSTRAALYLEPDPRVLGGAATWVRPTVVAGDSWALSTVLAEVRRWSESSAWRRRAAERWRRFVRRFIHRRGSGWLPQLQEPRVRRPFGRLRAVLVLGRGRLGPDDLALLAEHGVTVIRPEV